MFLPYALYNAQQEHVERKRVSIGHLGLFCLSEQVRGRQTFLLLMSVKIGLVASFHSICIFAM